MADKVAESLTDWWTVETGPVSDTSYYKLVTKDGYMQCCNGDCVKGTAEEVVEQWIPFIGLYSKENLFSKSIVIGFGRNWVQYQYRCRYRANKDESFKELFGNSVLYVNDDNGLIEQTHHMMDPKSWETFLNAAQEKLEKREKQQDQKKTDL